MMAFFLRTLVVLTALTLSLPSVGASRAWAASGIDSGKGTIGMVCTDFAGNEITWKQSGAENGFRYEQCVHEVISASADAILASSDPRGGVPLQTVIGGLSEFMTSAEKACRSRQIDPWFFY